MEQQSKEKGLELKGYTMKSIVDLACQLEETCRFCYPPEKERILYETENFYVMVSLGPIVEGYLLIVSKKHIPACANIPKEYLQEYLALKEKVKGVLIQVYGSCIFYEHGKTGSCLIGKDHRHCFHAHLHCVPVNLFLSDVISLDMEGCCFESLEDAYGFAQKLDRYLYVEDSHIMVFVPNENLRSQYLRYKLSTTLGFSNLWNWVEFQNWDIIMESVRKLKPYFS